MNDHELAADCARQAGELLLDLRARGASKDDGDREANDLLLALLAEARPDDAILSEESKDSGLRLERDRVWIIDPLDGTREFGEEGRTDWAVHVALVVGGTPFACTVALPAQRLVLSTMAPTVLPPAHDGRPRLLVSRTRPPALAEHIATALDAALVPLGSAGAKAMAVVQGIADVYAHSGGQYEWDSAAPVGVALAAGCHCSRIDGAPLVYNRPDPYLPDLLVCRPELAARVLEAVATAAPSSRSLSRVRLLMSHARWFSVATACILTLGACSSSSSHSTANKVAAFEPPACTVPTPKLVTVQKVAGTSNDYTLTSFDGAKIRLHWYPLDHEAPVILMGPGWGEAGAEEKSGTGLFGDSPVSSLKRDGYHVLTWDPRGFGKSTGTITVDSPDAEAVDVRRMLDWLATQPNVQTDGPNDPRAGMVGGSYGGGIQLVTAATDCRVDAIVPTIAWHSLVTSLGKADTYKAGWSNLLYTTAAGRDLDPHITTGHDQGNRTGVIDDDVKQWFTSRGPGDLMNQIKIPTLIIQGTVDTLFTLDEAVTNYEMLRKNNVPVGMMWFCGGHGVCLTKSDAAARRNEATTLWLARWLKRDASVDTGTRIDIIDQNATRYVADDYPLPAATPVTADGNGTLALKAEGGAGPAVIPTGSKAVLGPIVAGITPAPATNAVNVKIDGGDAAAMIVGAPKLDLTYSGTTPPGLAPVRVFAQLVDDTTGVVIGNQITPLKVTLDGKSHTTSVPLEMISFTLAPGANVTLQIVATTGAYAVPRLGGSVTFSKAHIELPVVTGLTRKG